MKLAKARFAQDKIKGLETIKKIDSSGGMSPLIENGKRCLTYDSGNCVFIITVITDEGEENEENAGKGKEKAVLTHLDTDSIAPPGKSYVINQKGEIIVSKFIERLGSTSQPFYRLPQMYNSDDSLGEDFSTGFGSYEDPNLETFLTDKFGQSFWTFLQEGLLNNQDNEYTQHINPYNLMTFFIEGLEKVATTININEFKILFNQLSPEIRYQLYLSQIHNPDLNSTSTGLDLYPFPKVAELTKKNKVKLIIGEGLAIDPDSLVNYLDAVEKIIAFYGENSDLEEVTIHRPKDLEEQLKNRVLVVGVKEDEAYYYYVEGNSRSSIYNSKKLVVPESIKLDLNKGIREQILEGFGIPLEWDYTDTGRLSSEDQQDKE